MVTTIPGSEVLTSTLNMISQSLQIPVIIFLVVFAVFAVLAIGGLISEYTSRKKITPELIEELIYSISNAASLDEIKNVIKNANIYESQKVVLIQDMRLLKNWLNSKKINSQNQSKEPMLSHVSDRHWD